MISQMLNIPSASYNNQTEYASFSAVAVILAAVLFWAWIEHSSMQDYCYSSSEAFARHDWESSSPAGTILTEEHLEAIALRQWKTVLSWVAFHPDQISKFRDAKGQTVLHHAALFRAPEHVMESILWVAPELASITNKEGELALHWAVRLSTPTPVLSLLLHANPETSFWSDSYGSTPLSLLWERHQTSLLQIWRTEREKLLQETNHTWKQIISVFRAVHEECRFDFDEKFLPLHVAASRRSPPCLFPLMIQVYKEEVSEGDRDGRLPLTLACESPSANRSCDVLTKIQLLIREDPETAQFVDPRTQRYPLQIALASGISWSEGIQSLLQAYPIVVSMIDPIENLFPFALAATWKLPHESGPESEVIMKDSLSTIFSVLRADPSVLKLCGF